MTRTHLVYDAPNYGQTENAIPGIPVRVGTIIGTADVVFVPRGTTFSAMNITIRSLDGRLQAELIDPYGDMNALGFMLGVTQPSPARNKHVYVDQIRQGDCC